MTTIFLSDEDLYICETASPEVLKGFVNSLRQQQAEQEAALQRATRERDERADQYFAANRSLVAAMQERDEARAALEFYASPDTWAIKPNIPALLKWDTMITYRLIDRDNGDKARVALGGEK